ncbi:hypothetical protein [Afipia birgiae]|uniref:hypothetical protein n=1 Tax=Afipia birgiae TaxID=151414 RepID=UPI0002E5955E|nr:hypothetical protein [Afipia birgiae]
MAASAIKIAMIENLLSEHDIALNVIAKGKQLALTKISVVWRNVPASPKGQFFPREKMGSIHLV